MSKEIRILSRWCKTWWRHQMETFSELLAICAGNSPAPANSPHIGQWRGALMFSLICVWINGWVNNREAGDLRRYRAHYDVTVMINEWERKQHRWRRLYFNNLVVATQILSCARDTSTHVERIIVYHTYALQGHNNFIATWVFSDSINIDSYKARA